jgi:hypothetical protein
MAERESITEGLLGPTPPRDGVDPHLAAVPGLPARGGPPKQGRLGIIRGPNRPTSLIQAIEKKLVIDGRLFQDLKIEDDLGFGLGGSQSR